MTVTPQPDQIRQLVARTFAEMGVVVTNIFDLNETIVVEEGRYRARSYRASGLMAMWLIPAGVVQFYAADGTLLRTINLFRELEPQAVAA